MLGNRGEGNGTSALVSFVVTLIVLLIIMAIYIGSNFISWGNILGINSSPDIKGDSSEYSTDESNKDVTLLIESSSDNEAGANQIPDDLNQSIDMIINTSYNNLGIMGLIVDYDKEFGTDDSTKYYNSDTLYDGMLKDDNLDILVKSDNLNIDSFEKVSKFEYNIVLINELGETGKLNMIKIDDKWLLNIAEILGTSIIEVASDAEVTLNGVKLDSSLISGTESGTTYSISNIVKNAKATVSYNIGLGNGVYTDSFIGGLGEKTILKYELEQPEIDVIISDLPTFWNELKNLAINKDYDGLSNIIASGSRLAPDIIIESLGDINDGAIRALEFTKRVDGLSQQAANVCYLSGPNRIKMHLKGTMYIKSSNGRYKEAWEYCWVELEFGGDGYKLYDASEEIWLGAGLSS